MLQLDVWNASFVGTYSLRCPNTEPQQDTATPNPPIDPDSALALFCPFATFRFFIICPSFEPVNHAWPRLAPFLKPVLCRVLAFPPSFDLFSSRSLITIARSHHGSKQHHRSSKWHSPDIRKVTSPLPVDKCYYKGDIPLVAFFFVIYKHRSQAREGFFETNCCALLDRMFGPFVSHLASC